MIYGRRRISCRNPYEGDRLISLLESVRSLCEEYRLNKDLVIEDLTYILYEKEEEEEYNRREK
jgi:hypothetical protein